MQDGDNTDVTKQTVPISAANDAKAAKAAVKSSSWIGNLDIANKFNPFSSEESEIAKTKRVANISELQNALASDEADKTIQSGNIENLKKFKIRDVIREIINIDKDEPDLTKHVTHMYKCLTLLADRFGEKDGYDTTASYLGRSLANTPGNVLKGAVGATAFGVGLAAAPLRAGIGLLGHDEQNLSDRTTATDLSRNAVKGVNYLWEGAKKLGTRAYNTFKGRSSGGAGYTRRRRNKHKTSRAPAQFQLRDSLAATSTRAPP